MGCFAMAAEPKIAVQTESDGIPRVALREDDAAVALGVSMRTLRAWRYAGIGPEFSRVGKNTIVYGVDELRDYVAKNHVRK